MRKRTDPQKIEKKMNKIESKSKVEHFGVLQWSSLLSSFLVFVVRGLWSWFSVLLVLVLYAVKYIHWGWQVVFIKSSSRLVPLHGLLIFTKFNPFVPFLQEQFFWSTAMLYYSLSLLFMMISRHFTVSFLLYPSLLYTMRWI